MEADGEIARKEHYELSKAAPPALAIALPCRYASTRPNGRKKAA
jgi:hypothetical protein